MKILKTDVWMVIPYGFKYGPAFNFYPIGFYVSANIFSRSLVTTSTHRIFFQTQSKWLLETDIKKQRATLNFNMAIICISNRTEWRPICLSRVWLQTELDNTKFYCQLIIKYNIRETNTKVWKGEIYIRKVFTPFLWWLKPRLWLVDLNYERLLMILACWTVR